MALREVGHYFPTAIISGRGRDKVLNINYDRRTSFMLNVRIITQSNDKSHFYLS